MRWRELLREAAASLAAAGIEDSRFEARLLAGHAASLAPEQLLLLQNEEVPSTLLAQVTRAIGRRVAREPVSHILGWREFWGLRFAVDATVLTPRPDSETLVEAVLAGVSDRLHPWRLLDLGTGSGCLALSLLSELPHARALAVDISPHAIAVAAGNARELRMAARIDFQVGNWTDGISGTFDLLVCNPPYIVHGDLASLEPEVARYEPRLALDGGEDGLVAYRAVVNELPALLSPGGLAAFEVGFGQAAAVEQLIGIAGVFEISRHRDLAGIERVVRARRVRENLVA